MRRDIPDMHKRRDSVLNGARLLIQLRPLISCLAAQKRIMLFKGPGYLNTPLPPLPLDSTFNSWVAKFHEARKMYQPVIFCVIFQLT
jgi:hypothetical protein